jgi:uncharacterized membrane protein YfcA
MGDRMEGHEVLGSAGFQPARREKRHAKFFAVEFPPRNVSSPSVKLILIAIATGLVAGLLGALCGVGGGIVMVPAFVTFLGLAQKQAVATSLAVVIVTALAATANNARVGGELINWKIVAVVGLASALTAWFGSDLMRSLSNQTLTRTFGIVLVIFGARMLIKG